MTKTEQMHPDMSDVDAAGTAAIYQRLIAMLGDQVRAQESRALELLAPRPGDRFLDVGCGAGEGLVPVAETVAPDGEVVGIDVSAELLARADEALRSRDLPIRLLRSDAYDTGFAEESFDICRAERLLQHLDEPAKAVNEMARVLRRGGGLMLSDVDYDSLLIDAEDLDVTAVVVRRRADAAKSGRVGRQLRRLMLGAGLADVQVEGATLIWTDYEVAMTSLDLEKIARDAVDAGELGAAPVESWLADLSAKAERGQFFLSSSGFSARGVRPR